MVAISGGAAFERMLKELSNQVQKAATVEIGFPENSSYPNGTSLPLVAFIQEFGAPSKNIPPRPYFRQMIADKSAEWPEAIAHYLKQNNYDAAITLDVVGQGIKGQLQQSISQFNGVPLKPSTITAKGSAKQLVDTGQMLRSVDYKVT